MSQVLNKKILLVITEAHWGGAQRFVYVLAKFLKSQSWRVVVVAGGQGRLISRLQKAGVKTIRLKPLTRKHFSPLRDFRAFFRLVLLFRKEFPDILQLHSSKVGFYGSLAARLARNPRVIYRIGGWAFNEPVGPLKKRLYLWLEKLSSPFKDAVIVNSRHDLDQALALKIAPRQKLRLVYNGIDCRGLKFIPRFEARNFIRQKIADGASRKISLESALIGTIANHYQNKGLHVLVKSALRAKQRRLKARWVVIGDGPQRRRLEQLISRTGLAGVIFLLKEVPDASRYLKAFDVFVLPSLKEGQPWVILEAMAARLPIVATRVGGVGEMILHKKTGLLVDPADAVALSRAVEQLVHDEKLARALGKKAQKLVEEKFHESAMFSQMLQIYQDLG